MAVLTLAATPAVAQDGKADAYKDLGSVSDVGLKAIEIAMPELRRQHPDWQNYTIGVLRWGDRLIVNFCPKKNKRTIDFVDGAGNVAASIPQCPGSLSVEMDKNTLEVVSVHHDPD